MIHLTKEDLYLNLIKKTLSFMLWPEPPKEIKTEDIRRKPIRRFLFSMISKSLSKRNMILMKKQEFTDEKKTSGAVWSNYAHTMIGMKRLDNLQFCIETVIKDKIPGDFIETGVWRGGACIFMRAILKAYDIRDRKVFVADSFEGLPRPNIERYPLDDGCDLSSYSYLAVSQEQVMENFRRYDLLDEQVVFLKGLFKDSLPIAPIGKLAVLRLDGDLYESTMDALKYLYPKLSPGGFCVVDDYALPNCRGAVSDYRKIHGITEEIKMVDWTGVYWRKNESGRISYEKKDIICHPQLFT